jgi:hypothetical protein
MMDGHFLRYQTVLVAGCNEGNLTLSSQFAEAVLVGTWRAQLFGSDTFSETGHTPCAMYLWPDLQAHIIMQGYIELDFIAHPDVSSVVVEHLIQTRVPMEIHEAMKEVVVVVNASAKASSDTVEKMESRIGRQSTDILKLQQYESGASKVTTVVEGRTVRGQISAVARVFDKVQPPSLDFFRVKALTSLIMRVPRALCTLLQLSKS